MNEENRNVGAHDITPQGGTTQGYPQPSQQGQAPYNPPQPYGSAQGYGQQQYSLPSQNYYGGTGSPPAQLGRERSILAAILIGGGIIFFLQQFTPFNFGDFVMPVIGAAFIAAYLNTRQAYRVGFLIPGCILLGIGAGNLLENFSPLGQWNWFDVSGLMLGFGFCLIWAFERRQWWALIPGGILIATSLANFWVLTKLWPLALVGLGAYLLYDQYRRRQRL